VITISISAEALAAIAATLPDGREAGRRSDGIDRLAYLREPGQSYSEGSSVAQKPVGPELNLAEFALMIITR